MMAGESSAFERMRPDLDGLWAELVSRQREIMRVTLDFYDGLNYSTKEEGGPQMVPHNLCMSISDAHLITKCLTVVAAELAMRADSRL